MTRLSNALAMVTGPVIFIVLLGGAGFLLGYWAARRESRRRRFATAIVVGLVVALAPVAVGFVAS